MSTIDLYRITMGSAVWTITNAASNQTYDAGDGNELYIATPMKRGGIEQKNEISKADIEVTIPIDHPLAIELLTTYNEQIMTLSVFTKRDATTFVSWKGRLASIKPGSSDFTMTFESVFTSLRRPGLRARYQKSCRHALYGRGCRLDPADFQYPVTLTDISGVVLTATEAAAQEDGFFQGGMAEAPDGALAYIIAHSGTQVQLQRMNYSLQSAWDLSGSGLVVNLYPGCNHTRSACNSKFNNLLNYGGFDWIPSKNPMGGSSIM